MHAVEVGRGEPPPSLFTGWLGRHLQTTAPTRQDALLRAVTFGQALPRHEIRVVDDGSNPLPDRREGAYPTLLQETLGAGYQVRNFGYAGATASATSSAPYVKTPTYTAAVRFAPHATILMLGTNDAQFAHAEARDDTAAGLARLGEEFAAMPAHPSLRRAAVLLGTSAYVSPAVKEIDQQALTEFVRSTTERVAAEHGWPLIDFLAPTADRPEDFPDGLHPNQQATRRIAETAFRALQHALTSLRA